MGRIEKVEYRCDWCFELLRETKQGEDFEALPGHITLQGVGFPLSNEDLCKDCMDDLVKMRQQKINDAFPTPTKESIEVK